MFPSVPQPNLQAPQIPAAQYTDPLQTLAQIGNLRTQALQRQGAQQELATGQIKLLQAQEDLADQQKLRQVYQNWYQSGNPKLDDLVSQAGAAGVGPRTLMPLQNQIIEHRKNLAQATEAEFKNTVSKQNQQTQSFNAVASVPSDQRPAALTTERNSLISNGYANPNEVPENYPGDVAFEELRHHARTQEQELALAKDAREAEQAKQTLAKTGQEVTAGAKAQLVSDLRTLPTDPQTGALTPAADASIRNNPAYKGLNLPPGPLTASDITKFVESTIPEKDLPEYQIKKNEADALKGMKDQDWQNYIDTILPDHNSPLYQRTSQLVALYRRQGKLKAADDAIKAAGEQLGKTESAVATARATTPIKIDLATGMAAAQLGAGLGGGPGGPSADLHGEEYLNTLPPALAAQVKSIATGNDVLPARLTGPAILLKNAVYQYDPAYSPLLAKQRRDTLGEFDKTDIGHAGGQLLALNTLIHHGDLYQEVGAALKNGTWRPGNAAYNAVQSMFGKAPPLQANLVARFLAGETGKVATGGVPGEGEVNGILANLLNDNSPEQFTKAGQTIIGIAAGRMVPLKERAEQAKLQGLVQILGPSAREILTRRGFDPETMKPVQAGTAATPSGKRVTLNGREIVPRQGAWYYKDTGERAK